jgi:phage baseplate assembly protein gpV
VLHELVELVMRVNELERRFASAFRHGTVEQVDAEKHVVRIRIGEPEESSNGQPFLSPWVPYGQFAGALKVHTPPSVGQQMTMLNPTGDFRQAVAIPLTWSDANPSPSNSKDEHVLTFGDVRITLKSGSVAFKAGDHVMTVSASGTTFENGEIKHDGKHIDKTHVHKDVEPGDGLTGVPDH